MYIIDHTGKQLGPWPPPDITLFSRMYEKELTGASNLASLFFAPWVFLFSIPILFVYVG